MPDIYYKAQVLTTSPKSCLTLSGTILFVKNYFHLERDGLPKNEIDAVFSKFPTLTLKEDVLQCTPLLDQRQDSLGRYLQILKNDFLKYNCVFNKS